MTDTYTIPRGALVSTGDGWRPAPVALGFTPSAPHSATGEAFSRMRPTLRCTVILNPVTAALVYGETVGGMGAGR